MNASLLVHFMGADYFIINVLRILIAFHKLCVHMTPIQWSKMVRISKLTYEEMCKFRYREAHLITPSFHHSLVTLMLEKQTHSVPKNRLNIQCQMFKSGRNEK